MKHANIGFLKLRVTGWPDASDQELDDMEIYEQEDDFFARGTGVGESERIYEVTIHYCDPHGGKAQSEQRLWVLEVCASSANQAKRLATRDFRLLESLSAGPWKHEIVDVLVLGES